MNNEREGVFYQVILEVVGSGKYPDLFNLVLVD